MRKEKNPRDNAGNNNGVGAPRGHYSKRAPGVSSQPIFVDNRVIGEVTPAGEFQKHIDGSIHLLRRPRAIAWDVSTLKDAEDAGAHSVLVIDRETGDEYRAPLSTVWRKGWPFDRGHGDQWALRLEYFNKGELGDQLQLFEGGAS